jgi:hypothetical protein
MKLEQCAAHFAATYFSWIGAYVQSPGGEEPVFYFRIQSPVIIVEFDHHSGVFLNNAHPAKFHVHTLMRTPNAGDYGMALRPLIQGQEQSWVWEEDLKAEEKKKGAEWEGSDEWKFRANQ